MSLTDALDVRAGEDAHLVLRRASVLDPVAGIDAVHDVVVRDGRIVAVDFATFAVTSTERPRHPDCGFCA